MQYKYSAQQIVRFLHDNGLSDKTIAQSIGKTRVTIHRIRNGLQSGYQCVEDLHTLLKLSKL